MSFKDRLLPLLSAIAVLVLTSTFNPVFAQTAPSLGVAQSFAVLGASSVTNTGPSVVNGDLGVSPSTSITGFPPGVVNGTTHDADAVAGQAQANANTAYNSLAGQPCNTILTGQDLGGLTLTPGVYCFASSAQLTGTLTLNGQGNPNAVFIFQIGSSLTTASNSSVVLINGAQACSVFFQVGSSATLGTGTQFTGNILALASVTLNTNATLAGRAIGLTAAVTLDSNTVSVPLCGTIQVCKVAGLGVAVGTNFTFNLAGVSVTVAAGTAPLGSCSTPVQVAIGATLVAEALPPGVILTGVSTLPSPGLLISSNLAGGTATVSVTTGGQTTVTFIDAVPPPLTGFVQVCKIAGAGIAVGANFTFNVAGTMQTIQAGLAPGGTCGMPVSVPAGSAIVTETIPAGTLVAGVSTLPSAGLLVSSNLGTGTATVTVTAGGQTIVTFVDAAIPINPNMGFLQVCKVAGAGISAGTNFSFNVGGTMQTIAAGSVPGGTCGTPVMVTAGPAVVTETIPALTVLAGVFTSPSAGLLVSSNLAAGTATVTVNAGGQTIVTFIDAAMPMIPTNGFLQVCKIGGVGILPGASFTFNVAGTQQIIAAGPAPGGTCGAPVSVLAGNATITETVPGGTVLVGVSTLPSTGLLVSANLATGTATVTVIAGGQTIVTFVDVVPVEGAFQICKVAGAGVPVGTNFTFSFGGSTVVVPAGATLGSSCSPLIVAPVGPIVITETPVSNPADSFQVRYATNLNIGDSVVNLTNAGTFIDPAAPTTSGNICVNAYTFDASEELLSCCSCLVTPNGLESLSVRNDLISNTLTPGVPTSVVIKLVSSAPVGGTCSASRPTEATLVSGLKAWGTTLHQTPNTPLSYATTETPFTQASLGNSRLASVSTLPTAGLLVSSNLPLGTATITVTPAGLTIVTFTNGFVSAELNRLTTLCQFIQTNGSGFGICKSCRLGGLGANQQ